MVRKASILLLLAGVLAADLIEQVRAMMPPRSYEGHKRLVALLFENRNDYCGRNGCDPVKIARTLKENGLLSTALPRKGEATLRMECAGEHPLFFMKTVDDTLRRVGLTGLLTKEAKLDEEGFVWSLSYRAESAPDPVALAEALAKKGVKVTRIERIGAAGWGYALDLSDAKLEARKIRSGEIRKVVRPLRPVWLDVSGIGTLSVRELPGSHWYADVVVYDKMLHILSMTRHDTRTRFLRLRLPKGAAYVKIGDRFTLENIRSGLKLSARGAR